MYCVCLGAGTVLLFAKQYWKQIHNAAFALLYICACKMLKTSEHIISL